MGGGEGGPTPSAFYPDGGGNRYCETFVCLKLHGVLMPTYCCKNVRSREVTREYSVRTFLHSRQFDGSLELKIQVF